MSRRSQPAQVPGATPPAPAADAAPAAPSFEQLRDQKIFEIAELSIEGFKTPADQAELDALDEELRTKLHGYYDRFRQAPPDPTPAQIQEGADVIIDAGIAMARGAVPTAAETQIDPTQIDKPVLTKDGWVCPAAKGTLKKAG
jgi:hypothetical protein